MRKRESCFGAHHPAVTFAFFMAAIVLTVMVQHPAYVAVSVVTSATLLVSLRHRRALPTLGWMVPLFVALSAINPLFSTGGRHIFFYLFGRPYTAEALCYGMVIAGMLVATLLWFACYNDVMTSDKFTCLFGSIIPSLSLILVMILRLIPSYQRKAKQIAGARQSLDPERTESKKGKTTEGVAVLSALTSWALEGAIVTADSMRARGYGTARRTNFRLYRWQSRDTLLLCLLTPLFIMMITAVAFGWTKAGFIPTLRMAPLTGTPVLGIICYGLFLLLPTMLNVLEELKWMYFVSKI